jgi:hypothetical protein
MKHRRACCQGIAQFNRGEFFEQHETLELLWLAEQRDVRSSIRAFSDRGRLPSPPAAESSWHSAMLTRGSGYLARSPPAVVCRCRRAPPGRGRGAARVERLGPARLGEFDWTLVPKVKLL